MLLNLFKVRNMEESYLMFDTKERMNYFGIKPVKSLGQNFLIDNNIVEKIVDSALVSEDDLVIEVGPGLGVMTEALAKKAGHVLAIEIDQKLIDPLSLITKNYNNISLINKDVLKVNIDDEINMLSVKYGKIKVVANLPYYITTPVIMKFMEGSIPKLDSMVFMVQQEVADRMTAGPGGKEYGALSIAVGYHSKAKKLFTVPPTCFIPRPGVDSCIIRLEIYKEPIIHVENQEYFFKVIKASFSQRRKTLANSLSNAPYLNINRENVYKALEFMNKDSMIRGETLTPEEFGILSNNLYLNRK